MSAKTQRREEKGGFERRVWKKSYIERRQMQDDALLQCRHAERSASLDSSDDGNRSMEEANRGGRRRDRRRGSEAASFTRPRPAGIGLRNRACIRTATKRSFARSPTTGSDPVSRRRVQGSFSRRPGGLGLDHPGDQIDRPPPPCASKTTHYLPAPEQSAPGVLAELRCCSNERWNRKGCRPPAGMSLAGRRNHGRSESMVDPRTARFITSSAFPFAPSRLCAYPLKEPGTTPERSPNA